MRDEIDIQIRGMEVRLGDKNIGNIFRERYPNFSNVECVICHLEKDVTTYTRTFSVRIDITFKNGMTKGLRGKLVAS